MKSLSLIRCGDVVVLVMMIVMLMCPSTPSADLVSPFPPRLSTLCILVAGIRCLGEMLGLQWILLPCLGR